MWRLLYFYPTNYRIVSLMLRWNLEKVKGKVPLDAIVERAKKYQPKPKITYRMIQEYVEKKYGFKLHTAYIAEVKRSLGLTMYSAPNAVEELKHPRKRPPKEKVEAITDALKYFEII